MLIAMQEGSVCCVKCLECNVVMRVLAGETDGLLSWHKSGIALTHILSCTNSHCLSFPTAISFFASFFPFTFQFALILSLSDTPAIFPLIIRYSDSWATYHHIDFQSSVLKSPSVTVSKYGHCLCAHILLFMLSLVSMCPYMSELAFVHIF